MSKYKSYLNKICIITILVMGLTTAGKAQFSAGALGLNAGIGLPAGITMSSSFKGINGLSQIGYATTASANFVYVIVPSFQVEAGLGFGSASFTVPSGNTAPASQSVVSFSAGGKFFLSKGDVMPYVGAAFSYSSLPKVKTGTGIYETEVSGSIMTVLGCFGAQAFVNSSKTIALFIQMGVGFNSGTLTTKSMNVTADNGQSVFNFGGSAIGGSIYF